MQLIGAGKIILFLCSKVDSLLFTLTFGVPLVLYEKNYEKENNF